MSYPVSFVGDGITHLEFLREIRISGLTIYSSELKPGSLRPL